MARKNPPRKLRKQPKQPLDHSPEAVAQRRRERGLSQAALAAKVGVVPSLICEIEKGTRNAPPWRLKQLALALGCEITDLMPATVDRAAS